MAGFVRQFFEMAFGASLMLFVTSCDVSGVNWRRFFLLSGLITILTAIVAWGLLLRLYEADQAILYTNGYGVNVPLPYNEKIPRHTEVQFSIDFAHNASYAPNFYLWSQGCVQQVILNGHAIFQRPKESDVKRRQHCNMKRSIDVNKYKDPYHPERSEIKVTFVSLNQPQKIRLRFFPYPAKIMHVIYGVIGFGLTLVGLGLLVRKQQ